DRRGCNWTNWTDRSDRCNRTDRADRRRCNWTNWTDRTDWADRTNWTVMIWAERAGFPVLSPSFPSICEGTFSVLTASPGINYYARDYDLKGSGTLDFSQLMHDCEK